MFEKGEIVLIENEEYIILSIINDSSNKYIYLESIKKPKELIVGKLIGNEDVETLSDKKEIEYALTKFNELKMD